MTPHSHARIASLTPDRAARVTTILLIGKIITETSDELCKVRNVSDAGMGIETLAPLIVGQKVRIELRNLFEVTGTVAWSVPPAAGIHFDAPVDVSQTLAPAPRTDAALRSPKPRTPRLSASCKVAVTHDRKEVTAELKDLSQSGVKICLPHPPAAGELVRIAIPGLPARLGAICWTKGEQTGIAFLKVIPFDELALWLKNPAQRYALRYGRARYSS